MQRIGRFLAAAAFVTLTAAACGSTAAGVNSAPAARAGLAGYKWSVVTIGHDGRDTGVPARYKVYLLFTPNGQYGANDPVNYHFGTYRQTGDGFTTSGVGQTAVGYAGRDPVTVLAIDAISRLDNVADASVRLTGSQLDVTAGGYSLTCVRAGAQADFPAPAYT